MQAKRTVLRLEQKLEILKPLEKGLSQHVVKEKLVVPKSTVADIWKDRHKIHEAIASSESPALSNKKRCAIRSPKFDLVDEACWICQQRSKGAPVSGVLLQEKAVSKGQKELQLLEFSYRKKLDAWYQECPVKRTNFIISLWSFL